MNPMRPKPAKAGAKVRNARPTYEQDNGQLTDKQITALRRLVPMGKMKVTSSLL